MYKSLVITALLSLAGATQIYGAGEVAGVAASFAESFDEAVKAYDKKQYEKAYKMLEKLFDIKPDDPRVNFYLGRAALETKRYEEALLAFERVLIIEPAHIRSRLEMARAYFELKEFDSAESEFDKVLESELPKNVRAQIEGYKKAIDAAKKRHFITAYVMAGVGWDSNINNGIGTKDYTISSPFGDLTLTGEKPKSESFHTEIFGLNHMWNLSSVKEGLFWQNTFTAYLQSYFKTGSSNARYFGLTAGPGYRTKSFEISLPLSTDYLIYGSKTPYMQTYSIGPKASYKLSDTTIMEASYTMKLKRYSKVDSDRDSSYQEFYLGLRELFPKSGSMVTLGFTAGGDKEDEKSITKSRTDITYNSQRYSLSLYQPLIEGLDMTAGISYSRTEYDEMDKNFLRVPEDKALAYSLGLMKSIGKSSMVTLNGSYTDNDSNIENKVYNKKTVNLSYIYNF